MREADALAVELDHALRAGRVERLLDACALPVRGCHDVDRRPGERRDQQQDVEGFARKAGEAAAEQVAKAVRHMQRLARRGPRARADELAPEFEREEGVAGRRLLHPGQLGSRELEPEALLEEPVNAAEAERADRELVEPLLGERALELEGHCRLRPRPVRGQQADPLLP